MADKRGESGDSTEGVPHAVPKVVTADRDKVVDLPLTQTLKEFAAPLYEAAEKAQKGDITAYCLIASSEKGLIHASQMMDTDALLTDIAFLQVGVQRIALILTHAIMALEVEEEDEPPTG